MARLLPVAGEAADEAPRNAGLRRGKRRPASTGCSRPSSLGERRKLRLRRRKRRAKDARGRGRTLRTARSARAADRTRTTGEAVARIVSRAGSQGRRARLRGIISRTGKYFQYRNSFLSPCLPSSARAAQGVASPRRRFRIPAARIPGVGRSVFRCPRPRIRSRLDSINFFWECKSAFNEPDLPSATSTTDIQCHSDRQRNSIPKESIRTSKKTISQLPKTPDLQKGRFSNSEKAARRIDR